MNRAAIRYYAYNLRFDTTVPTQNPHNLLYPGKEVTEVHILPAIIGEFLSVLNHLKADEKDDKDKTVGDNDLSSKQLVELIRWLESELTKFGPDSAEYGHLQQIRDFLSQPAAVEG